MKNKKKKTPYIIITIAACCLWALVIGGIFVLGVPDKVNAARVGRQIDLGNKYLAEADYDKAEVKFSKALKISPKSSKAATGMAKVYNKKKQPEKAVKYLKKASANVTDGQDAKEIQQITAETEKQLTAQNTNVYANDLSKINNIVNNIIIQTMPVAVVTNIPTETPTPKPKDKNKDRKVDDGNENGEANLGRITEPPTPTPETHTAKVTIEPVPITWAPRPDDPTPTITSDPGDDPVVTIEPGDDTDITPTPSSEDESDTSEESGEQEITEVTVTPEPDDDSDTSSDQDAGETPDIEGTTDTEETPEQGEDSDSTNGAGDQEVDGIPPATGDDEKDTEADQSDATEESAENTDTEENAESSTGDPLEDYVNNNLSKELPLVNWNDTQAAFTYGETSAPAVTGRLAETREDLDGDGSEELLVVEVKSGTLGFRIYKEENGTVELKTSKMAATGMETPLESISYGNTQECFLVNYEGKWEIGFAAYCYGYDSGEQTPGAVTAVEVYQVETDDSVTLCASGKVINGQGQEGLASSLAPAGLTGSWNSSSTETLQSMGYGENPVQDLSGAPDPIGDGISDAEKDCTDLAVLTMNMPAGSGTLTLKNK